jgi:hypothetical protein
VLTELGVGLGFVVAVREIAIGGREAIRPVLAGHAAELPERLLQALGESREALAATNRLDEAPARVGQPEVINEMREGLTGERDAELGSVGEVREGLTSGRVLLTKDQLAFRSLRRPPMGDAPLQGTQHALAEATGMASVELFEQACRPDVGHGLKQGNEVLAPDLREGIGAGTVGPQPLLARQRWISLDASPRSLAEAGAGGRGRLGVTLSS